MNIWPARGRRGGRGRGSQVTLPWPLALGSVPATAALAAWLLRPRRGLIVADPVALNEVFSAEELRRIRRFSRPQLLLGAASALIQGALLATAAVRGPRLLRAASPLTRPPRTSGSHAGAAVAGAALNVVPGLAVLPLRAFARRRALRAGLATQSWPGWAADVAKSTAVSGAFSAGLATGVTVLMRRQPRWWWAIGGMAVAGLGAALSFLAPVLLDPLFNRFRPLAPGRAREDVLELARHAGVEVGEVFEVDASRRTTAANAYVTGLGATKRVVLFDTLLARFERDETRLVVAHELAHVRHRDVAHGLLYAGLLAPVVLHAAAAVAGELGGQRGLRDGSPSVLPALVLGAGMAGALAAPASAWLSRRVEARADAFSLVLTDAPAPFESFERRIVLQNLADPAPPRWLAALVGSHPPTLERIGFARAYARGAGRSVTAPAVTGEAAKADWAAVRAHPGRTRAGS
jgi:STE24 endopeptidase